MIRHVALNATRYDVLPSGARSRAVGLAAALLRRGLQVTMITSGAAVSPADADGAVGGSASLTSLIRDELGADGGCGGGALHEIERADSRLRVPRLRVRWALPDGVDAFVTDYHPVHADVPTALTIHDLRHVQMPGETRTVRGVLRRFALRPLARHAHVVVTPTAAVAAECVDRLGVPREKIAVVPNGLMRPWRDAPPWRGGGPLVWVGTADRRKGFGDLLRTLSAAADSGDVRPLVVVGRDVAQFRAALAAHPQLAERDLVDVRGPLSDADVVALVRSAAAVVHPSRYEGFGMGVLEALAMGAPVLAGRCAAVAEVAGPGQLLLAPDDDSWRDALLAASRGEWPVPDVATVQRARSYTWDAAAEALLAALGG